MHAQQERYLEGEGSMLKSGLHLAWPKGAQVAAPSRAAAVALGCCQVFKARRPIRELRPVPRQSAVAGSFMIGSRDRAEDSFGTHPTKANRASRKWACVVC